MKKECVGKYKNRMGKPREDLDNHESAMKNSINDNLCQVVITRGLVPEDKEAFDIEAFAETCVMEEKKVTQLSKSSRTALQSCASPNNSKVPNLELTFEEEFRMYELDAMKENVQMGINKLISMIYFSDKTFFAILLSSLQVGSWDVIHSGLASEMQSRMRSHILSDLASKGPLWKHFGCFYILKDIPDSVKRETFMFSFLNIDLCYKYVIFSSRLQIR